MRKECLTHQHESPGRRIFFKMALGKLERILAVFDTLAPIDEREVHRQVKSWFRGYIVQKTIMCYDNPSDEYRSFPLPQENDPDIVIAFGMSRTFAGVV